MKQVLCPMKSSGNRKAESRGALLQTQGAYAVQKTVGWRFGGRGQVGYTGMSSTGFQWRHEFGAAYFFSQKEMLLAAHTVSHNARLLRVGSRVSRRGYMLGIVSSLYSGFVWQCSSCSPSPSTRGTARRLTLAEGDGPEEGAILRQTAQCSLQLRQAQVGCSKVLI